MNDDADFEKKTEALSDSAAVWILTTGMAMLKEDENAGQAMIKKLCTVFDLDYSNHKHLSLLTGTVIALDEVIHVVAGRPNVEIPILRALLRQAITNLVRNLAANPVARDALARTKKKEDN